MGHYQGVCILNPGQFLVALHLARLTPAAVKAQYSWETLQTILATLCLDAETRRKLVQAMSVSA